MTASSTRQNDPDKAAYTTARDLLKHPRAYQQRKLEMLQEQDPVMHAMVQTKLKELRAQALK